MSVWSFQNLPGYLPRVSAWSRGAGVDLYRRGYHCEVVVVAVGWGLVLWQSGSPWLLAAVGKTLCMGERSPDCFCCPRYSQLLYFLILSLVCLVPVRSSAWFPCSATASRLGFMHVHFAFKFEMSWLFATVTHSCRAGALVHHVTSVPTFKTVPSQGLDLLDYLF